MGRVGGFGEREVRSGRELLHTRSLYFCYYLALGAFYPFLNLYYEQRGLSGSQIGLLASVPALISPFAAPLWGGLADRFGIHRRVLVLALSGTLLAGFSYSLTSLFGLFLFISLMYAFFSSPITPLLDSAALEVASDRTTSYGQLRVWGTLGWIVSTWIVGRLAEGGLARVFYAFAAFMAAAVVVSLFQPPRRWLWREPIRQGLRQILSRRSTVVFLASVFLLWVANAGASQFLSIYMASIGSSEGLIGLAWAVSAMSEVPMMLLSGRLIRQLGISRLLIIAFFVYALRWALLSVISAPGWVVVVQLLQGVSFTAFLVGGVTYMHRQAPAGLGATAQAIFVGTSLGLGTFAGSLLGGFLYDEIGLARMFVIDAGVALAACLVFLLSRRRWTSA
jgi:PPP family 3-phenylpropionic acid transporter